MERGLYVPTRYIESSEVSKPVIFLAGPIQGAPNWQEAAIGIIQGLNPDVVVASPRRNIDDNFVYGEQVDWETAHLRRAAENGAIMFWLAKELDHYCNRAYAQTSRFELAEWKIRHERDGTKLIVGIEEGFSGARYIRRRFSQDCPEVPITTSLEETCLKVVEQIVKPTASVQQTWLPNS